MDMKGVNLEKHNDTWGTLQQHQNKYIMSQWNCNYEMYVGSMACVYLPRGIGHAVDIYRFGKSAPVTTETIWK